MISESKRDLYNEYLKICLDSPIILRGIPGVPSGFDPERESAYAVYFPRDGSIECRVLPAGHMSEWPDAAVIPLRAFGETGEAARDEIDVQFVWVWAHQIVEHDICCRAFAVLRILGWSDNDVISELYPFLRQRACAMADIIERQGESSMM